MTYDERKQALARLHSRLLTVTEPLGQDDTRMMLLEIIEIVQWIDYSYLRRNNGTAMPS